MWLDIYDWIIMPIQPQQVLDPGTAALFGALIGAASTIIVQVIAAFITAKHETRIFHRTLHKETIASVTDAYEHALNVLINMKRGGNPDRATYGNVFAQLSLRGSKEVNLLLEDFYELPQPDRMNIDIEKMHIPIKTTSETDLCRPPLPAHADHLRSG